MSAAPASSLEAGGPWMARSGQPAAICPPAARPFLSRGLSRARILPHQSQLTTASRQERLLFRWDREMEVSAAPAGADAPGHCHRCLVQWQNSSRLSPSSLLSSGRCVAASPMGTCRPFLYPTNQRNQQSHPSPQQSPNPPEPTHDQSAFLLSRSPAAHARLTTGHLSLTHLLFVPLSSSLPLSPSSPSPSPPAHKSPIPPKAAASLRPPPPRRNTPRHSHTTRRTSVCQRRDGGKRVSRTSSRLTWAVWPVPIAGTTNKPRTPGTC